MGQSYLLISEFKIFLFKWVSVNDQVVNRAKNLRSVSWFKMYGIVHYGWHLRAYTLIYFLVVPGCHSGKTNITRELAQGSHSKEHSGIKYAILCTGIAKARRTERWKQKYFTT